MTTYRVRISGSGFKMLMEDDDICCGFLKNEYVWARTPQEATASAMQKVRKKLSEKAKSFTGGDLKLIVDEIESDVPIWRLLENEGFVFYRADTAH